MRTYAYTDVVLPTMPAPAPDLDPALSPAETRPTAELLRALGDETRLRILALLRRGELCVCHIGEALDLQQPNASQHLGVLRRAGLVSGERRGGWMFYRLEPQPLARARVLDAVLDALPGGVLDELDARLTQRQRECP